jgi:hypothetical protein
MTVRFAVLDPLDTPLSGRLFLLSPQGSIENEVVLGYSAEVRFQPHTRELLVLESEADVAAPMKFFFRLLDSESMRQTVRREIPTRPMYAGFPGRSVAGPISSSSRYVYFLRSGPVIRYGDDLAFRLTPARWDRKSDTIEVGEFHVDSCHVDYGLTGNNEDDLFLHLSCECASTVALGSFQSPNCHFIRLEDLQRRQHGPMETNGSWLDSTRHYLYCVNRNGDIYEVKLREGTSRVLAHLQLGPNRSVPVHQIWGAAGEVHIGVADDIGNMGLGRVTEIWSVCAETGEFLGRRLLPCPLMNFVVTPDGKQLVGADPYSRFVFCLDRESGEQVWGLKGIGKAPSEILLLG